ncbi:FAD-linked oxidoreductase pyvE [Cladobotryum mycophilum]|uniref:FAD-linked oxidoreductase pyvE n=1 Tax=Cladobotryum mycophilum TaxID=491253 RepID=A0ABR0SRT9_9HYPO
MPDLQQLRQDLAGVDVLAPGDEGYEASLKRWSAACEKEATVVVRPTSASEVAVAIRFAVASKLPLTVACGTHASSGSSSSEGMVIDLSKMRNVDVDVEGMKVSFGGGCLWADVDGALEKYDLATVGGIVNHTGVGGLSLGGGHGYLTSRHGLTVDNIISMEVVLADGSIVETSDSENKDLFWALRGAGQQFGVVTRFTNRVHKQGLIWGGAIGFTPDKLEQLVAFVNEFHDRDNREGHCMALSLGYAPDASRALMVIPFFQGSEEDGKKYFSVLFEMEQVFNNTGAMTVAKVNSLFNGVFAHGRRRLTGSSNLQMPLKAEVFKEAGEMFWGFCDKRPDMELSAISIEIFPTHRIREVSNSAMAYANRGDYYDIVPVLGWMDGSLDGEVRTFNRYWCDYFRKANGYTQTSPDGPVGRYVNTEPDGVSPMDAFGGNLGRLRELKKKYDPGNVFHKWHGFTNAELEETDS